MKKEKYISGIKSSNLTALIERLNDEKVAGEDVIQIFATPSNEYVAIYTALS